MGLRQVRNMETQSFEENKKIAEGRSTLYNILSTIYLNEISHDLLRELHRDNLRSTIAELGFDTNVLNSNGNEEDFISDLEVEFAGLFIGPNIFHVFPYESVYFEKKINGTATVKAKSFYERYGLSIPENVPLKEHKVLPDHIGVELQFMKLLVEKEKKAWEEKNTDEVFRALKIQKEFLKEHLGRWAHLFCEKVISFATNPFYAEFAKLTDKFIQGEMCEMSVIPRN